MCQEKQPGCLVADAKCSPADLHATAQDNDNLTDAEKVRFENLLNQWADLFDGTLGVWQGDPHHMQLRDDAEPHHAKPCTVPQAHEQTLRNEVERLCKTGVLKRANRSEWAFPSFIVPKKDKTVRFINDLRESNKRTKRMPCPLPKTQDLLLKLQGFQWAAAPDLNMGCCHIRLDADSRKLCTMTFPWGKYEMQSLPMGLSDSPDMFQEKMSMLMNDFEFVRAHVDDLLVTSNGTFEEHLEHLAKVFKRLTEAGLKANARKSSFFQSELECLGCWIAREGIQPQPKKVQAMLNVAPPKNKTALRSFIGLVNYRRDSWTRRSDVLAPLSALSGKNSTWHWGDEQQKAFDTVKRTAAREASLAHPDFSKPFETFTDSSDAQLGAVIAQEGRPIACCSRKLTAPQLNHTVTERELLAIVETLKEFRNILLGQNVTVYADHKNLACKVHNTPRMMRWRLLIEEHGPVLNCVKGAHNVVADALSRLDLLPALRSEADDTVLDEPPTRPLADAFGAEALALTPNEKDRVVPIRYKILMREQRTDPQTQKLAKAAACILRTFHGGETKQRQLCAVGDKILVPASL